MVLDAAMVIMSNSHVCDDDDARAADERKDQRCFYALSPVILFQADV